MTMMPAVEAALKTGEVPGLVLVTGATGFLGQHLVRALLDQGRPVRALGRNPRIGLELAGWGADFRPVDLRDRPAMIAACRGVAAALHAGALSSAWGAYRDFHDANVGGTENLLAGCSAWGVARLVYISSPSVISRHQAQVGLDESAPYPEEYVSTYSETKAIAERRVAAAGAAGLETVILRPKAIYGPGDQALFPRLLEAVSRGRLPILGDGLAVTNITHVEDVVQAVLLALESKQAVGRTYLITGGEEVNLLEIARLLIDRLGLPPLRRRVAVERAMWVGRLLEEVWRKGRLKGEPPLTRYKVSVMGYSQTYDITAARRDLGYEPRVGWRDGVERFLADWQKQGSGAAGGPPLPSLDRSAEPLRQGGVTRAWPGSRDRGPGSPAGAGGHERAEASSDPPARARVRLSLLNAGTVETRERIFGLSPSLRSVTIPALFGLIEHPTRGPLLFDTGYSTAMREATRRMPERLYALATPVKITPREDAGAQLERRGIDPRAVGWVIVSHFDPDHIGGLKDFPNARIVCSWRAWAAIAGKTGFKALAVRLLPGLLPDDLAARVLLLPDPDGPPVGPFAHSLDLFGDGSIVLVALPGHAPGLLGAFVHTEPGGTVFLCADGCWSLSAIETGETRRGLHRLIAHDRQEQDQTYRLLARLRAEMPDVEVVPSHCPRTAARVLAEPIP